MNNNITRASVLLSFFALFLITMPVYAYGLGTSNISLNATSISITQGQSAKIAYTVNLSTGSVWGTAVNITNSQSLLSNGIIINLSTGTQDPPYSGTATVSTNANTKVGTYTVLFAAVGDDPTTNPVGLTVKINGNGSTTILPVNTSNKTNTTAVSTTNTTSTEKTTNNVNTGGVVTAQNSSKGYKNQNANTYETQLPEYISIFAVIILFAVIIIRLKML